MAKIRWRASSLISYRVNIFFELVSLAALNFLSKINGFNNFFFGFFTVSMHLFITHIDIIFIDIYTNIHKKLY